ncbi:hypothetical protein [Kiloniella sp. b19]|uniref:hypothetical protein n=1 Tax=Kiloniella sp. GXU_MW_B19 TaxID=3141326 RepID=UPI0031D91CFA
MLSNVLKVLVLCLIVGMLLAAFNTDAVGLLKSIGDLFREAWVLAQDFADWAGPYVVLGATVVLPLVGLKLLFGYLKKKRS